MILLKFRREKRIRQSFLLTNYCNFPRRILVTGGKHKASNRSDLPPFSHPAACSDGEVRGGVGRAMRRLRGGAAPPSVPSSRGFSAVLFRKSGPFPSPSAPIHLSLIERPSRGSFRALKEHPKRSLSRRGCQTPGEKLFPSFFPR